MVVLLTIFVFFRRVMVESDTAKYDTVVMENDSDDEERDYNFKTLYRHMHSEAKRKYVVSSSTLEIF